MRRLLLSFVPALILLVVTAAPAGAGWGYWSPSGCRGDIEWYRSSYGVAYWQWGYSERTGAHWVTEAHGFRAVYESRFAWECGPLGAVRSNPYYSGGLWRLDFERGQLTANY